MGGGERGIMISADGRGKVGPSRRAETPVSWPQRHAMTSLTILDAVILGIVQGLTEFLPISSTAHLRIVPALLGREDPGGAFSAVIQLGTLAAVVAVMWRDLCRLAGGCVAALASGRPLATPE